MTMFVYVIQKQTGNVIQYVIVQLANTLKIFLLIWKVLLLLNLMKPYMKRGMYFLILKVLEKKKVKKKLKIGQENTVPYCGIIIYGAQMVFSIIAYMIFIFSRIYLFNKSTPLKLTKA